MESFRDVYILHPHPHNPTNFDRRGHIGFQTDQKRFGIFSPFLISPKHVRFKQAFWVLNVNGFSWYIIFWSVTVFSFVTLLWNLKDEKYTFSHRWLKLKSIMIT